MMRCPLTTERSFLSGSMAPHQFFALIACVLCLGLSTIAINQATSEAEPSPAVQTAEVAPPMAQPIRL